MADLFSSKGDGPTWTSFTGEITVSPSIKVMGFKVGGVTVKVVGAFQFLLTELMTFRIAYCFP